MGWTNRPGGFFLGRVLGLGAKHMGAVASGLNRSPEAGSGPGLAVAYLDLWNSKKIKYAGF